MKNFILVGAPNSGKTTLYNWLTGSNYKTVNYPGSTVEYCVGEIDLRLGQGIKFIDTPGTYSLEPKSPDEEVTYSVLYKPLENIKNRKVILVLDGVSIERQLVLALQMLEARIPFYVVITMLDLNNKQGREIDVLKLEDFLKTKVFLFNGRSGEGLSSLISSLLSENFEENVSQIENEHFSEGFYEDFNNLKLKQIHWSYLEFQRAKNKIREITSLVISDNKKSDIFNWTRKVDQIVLGPLGYLIFLTTMTILFASLFWFSKPFSEGIEFVLGSLGNQIEDIFQHSLLSQFLSEGIINGFSAILVFVPQIFFLFIGLGLLESSGYLPRAATLVDHPFKKLGLSGRSFVPLLSGYACAVPALLAARNISSKRDRLITMIVTPLLSCSARIPVYSLLISFLLSDNVFLSGLVMAGIYILSMILGMFASMMLSKVLPPSKDQFFMMELPLYRKPKWWMLIKQAYYKTKSYVLRAGPIIFFVTILIWFSSQFPRVDGKPPEDGNSYAAQLGQFLEPVFKPMGVDWRVGVGLISAFAAREVFVSSVAVAFKVTSSEDEQQKELQDVMKNATFADGKKIFTVGSVVGLILFFMIALQCVSTVAVQIKESGSYKLAFLQLISFNLIGYLLAVMANQIYSFLLI